MQTIYIVSPHIDDAVFSLGAYMLSSNYSISVINVFSETNFVYESIVSKADALAIRKDEDKSALTKVGVENIFYMDLPEAPLRGYTLNNLFIKNGDEVWLDTCIVESIKQYITTQIHPNGEFFIPAAFGSHVDHLLVRTACQQLNVSKFYYADLPYAADNKRYRNENARFFLSDKICHRRHIDYESINVHMDLCRIYKSQFLNRFVDEMTNYLTSEQYTIWS
ncbi:PIG-L family deacetylase [Spirulina sp. CCNP1310]|uniref:PIG-L deacetylase family protein n=1 Tax=Spirulina sp. CCNP1310 TaxID=3110249 RepID=UPI002B21B00A|nr:PIG-L family deacetylase [Spirulina sp. CCNP1310]MEA5418052.1 PIG-L family deacetylase [Spirulina sp. CCNP1310]